MRPERNIIRSEGMVRASRRRGRGYWGPPYLRSRTCGCLFSEEHINQGQSHMGKKIKQRNLKKVIRPEVNPEISTSLEQTNPVAFDETVSIVMFLTESDRFRLKEYALAERTSLQRLGQCAWNAFLVSKKQPTLTFVSAGKTRKAGLR